MHLSDAHHSRKTIAGACMVVAPLVLLVAMVIHPASDMDEATQVATIAENLNAWYVAHLLALVAIALMVPVVLGLMHMLREREVALGLACLAAGLYRARAVQSWMAISVGAGAILFGFAVGAAMNWLAVVAVALLGVGLGAIGRMVLRETDEAWEHTPEYEGFRPVPGMR
jgi:hypothetical protein